MEPLFDYWTKCEAERYLEYYSTRLNDVLSKKYEIYNYYDNDLSTNKKECLLKLIFDIKYEELIFDVRILICKQPSTFVPELAAYIRDKNDDGFSYETLDCYGRLNDALTEDYVYKVLDAIDFEYSIRNSEEEDESDE